MGVNKRKSTFTVDAESVQGNPGATVTFSMLTVGEWKAYPQDIIDVDLVTNHVVSWTGIVDNEGDPMPNPADDPGVIDALYLPEQKALARLLWAGPDGESAKN